MPERLSAIDGSFLRVETPNAHMHVAWSASFRLPAAGPRPTLERLRRSVAGRLEHLPRFRRRLAYPPPGMGEPFWVDDPDFDVARHVLKLHFGLYADPEAFPQVSQLPEALDVSLGHLLRLREQRRTRGRSRDRPLVASG